MMREKKSNRTLGIGKYGSFLVIHRDTPAERNINPDNVSDEVYKKEYASEESRKNAVKWTIPQLLRKKETWLCAIAGGLLLLCQMGIISQLVVRNIEVGFSQDYL